MSLRTLRTSIVATLGPSSESIKTITSMVQAGMNVARLNFSHGTHAHHEKLYENVRKAEKRAKQYVTVLQDLSGPKLRVGALPDEGIRLQRGQVVRLSGKRVFVEAAQHVVDGKGGVRSKHGKDASVHAQPIDSQAVIPVLYKKFDQLVQSGTKLLLQDGAMELRVISKRAGVVTARVKVGGILYGRKGMNIPQAALAIPPITAKDKKDVLFGLELGVDAMALSFVQHEDDIKSLRRLIASYQKKHPWLRGRTPYVFAKIEKPQAVQRFAQILKEADGILVARGDLAVEVGHKKVPVLQKRIVDACLRASKPVIVATHMLESMTQRVAPTRAEVSDVANAVVDHADGVMLSGETATGAQPVEVVRMMAGIAKHTEGSVYDDVSLMQALSLQGRIGVEQSVLASAGMMAKLAKVDAVLLKYPSSADARLVSQSRPEVPLYALVEEEYEARQLNILWGVHALVVPKGVASGTPIQLLRWMQKKGVLTSRAGSSCLLVSAEALGRAGEQYVVRVMRLKSASKRGGR